MPPYSTADVTYLGKYRKSHIPQVAGFYEKFFFKPGNSGWPVFDTPSGGPFGDEPARLLNHLVGDEHVAAIGVA